MQRTNFVFIYLNDQQRKSVLDKPPALSALQSFETFLFLTALGRHPQALTTLTAALESAAKSVSGAGPEDRSSLADATGTLNSLIPKGYRITFTDSLTNLRIKRNNLTHFGHSPKDDNESIRLSFGTALPLMNAWAKLKHDIDLFEVLHGGLSDILQRSVDLIQDRSSHALGETNLIRGVRHWIIHHTRDAFLSRWELSVLDSDEATIGTAVASGFDYREKALDSLRLRDPNVTLSCPICSSTGAFVVELDEESLFNGNGLFSPTQGTCVYCDFHVPAKSVKLITELCADQLTTELLRQIRLEYGVKSG